MVERIQEKIKYHFISGVIRKIEIWFLFHTSMGKFRNGDSYASYQDAMPKISKLKERLAKLLFSFKKIKIVDESEKIFMYEAHGSQGEITIIKEYEYLPVLDALDDYVPNHRQSLLLQDMDDYKIVFGNRTKNLLKH